VDGRASFVALSGLPCREVEPCSIEGLPFHEVGSSSHAIEGASILLELALTSADGGHIPTTCEVFGPGNTRYRAQPRPLASPEVTPGEQGYEVRFPENFEGAPPLEPRTSYAVEWRSGGARRALLGRHQFTTPRRLPGELVPHQLEVVLNYVPGDEFVDLVWSYPYSSHPIPERTVRVGIDERPKLKEGLDQLVAALTARISTEGVHHPHKDLTPSIRPTRFGFYVLGGELPRAVIVYQEEIGHSTETRRRTVSADDFEADELSAW
jgi:hypothetical protein